MQLRSWLTGGSIVITGITGLCAACTSGGSDEPPSSGSTSGGGGSSTSSSGATASSPCEIAGRRICEKACACGTAPKCKTGYRNALGSFATFTWSDRTDCEGDYAVSRCKTGGKPGVDYDACAKDIEATACEGDVFVVPASCEPPRDAGAG